jgi:hypothetical protein
MHARGVSLRVLTWVICAGPPVDGTTSRRGFASAAAAGLLTALTPRSSRAVDAELYKNLNVDDPYLLMEPAGESFRGNKGIYIVYIES